MFNEPNGCDMVPKSQPVPLEQEGRIALPTGDASYHLNREQQTLRIWACKGTGPIKPIRVNGRLAWPTAEIKKLLGVA